MKLLLYVGVVVYLLLTPNVANYFGIEQVGTLSSMLLILVLVFRLLKTQGDLGLRTYFKDEAAILLICVLIIIAYFVQGYYANISNLIFFMLLPLLVSVLVAVQSTKVKINLKTIIIAIYFLECILAIYERVFTVNIFPYNIDADVVDVENWMFRSTGFFGHPLTNAVVVSTINGFILCEKFSDRFKLLSFVVGFIALLCFNARGAIIIQSLIGLFFLGLLIKQNKTLRILPLVMFACGMAIYLLFYTSLGGRLIHEDEILDGSAQTRLDVFRAFNYISDTDFLFGNPNNYLRITELLGAAGVENSYIVMIINYGIILSLLLFVALYRMINNHISKFSFIHKCILLSSFLVVGSLNNSLAGSTPWIVFLICIRVFYLKNIQRFNGRLPPLASTKL